MTPQKSQLLINRIEC